MDGRGRFLDNIFIERLWRSLKQEAVYLTEITDGFHAGRVIDGWIAFYNAKRPHSALAKRTPDEACWSNEKGKTAA
jgi:putative transposase